MQTDSTPKLFSNPRITLAPNGAQRAIASVKVADAIFITGLRIVEGKSGLFLSMPCKKNPGGEYKDIVFPASRETREQLQALVLEAYAAELAKAPSSEAGQ